MIRGWIVIREESNQTESKWIKIAINCESKWIKIKVNQNESMRFIRFESESEGIRIKNKMVRPSKSQIKKDFHSPRESKWIDLVRALNYTIIYTHIFFHFDAEFCLLISMHLFWTMVRLSEGIDAYFLLLKAFYLKFYKKQLFNIFTARILSVVALAKERMVVKIRIVWMIWPHCTVWFVWGLRAFATVCWV